jgi:hypothetical protein
MILLQSPFAIAILKSKDMVISLANDAIKEIWSKGKNVEGEKFIDVLPELIGKEFPLLLDKVFTTGIPFYGNEYLAPLLYGGKLSDFYFNFLYQPYYVADETVSRITIIAYHVTTADVKNAKTWVWMITFLNLWIKNCCLTKSLSIYLKCNLISKSYLSTTPI